MTEPAPEYDPTTQAYSMNDVEGQLIAGRYKLLQQIGEGGMGTVWMADQTMPVKRRVAIKLIRSQKGSSKTILSRFEAERQAIALMDHPNIARLLDAGATSDGSPFFVMELVKGIPLTDFSQQHKLTLPEKLSLFIEVCGAIQHAHQKGIIHRDLKPSNIMVESHDGRPVPKVIDFGLAKAATGIQLTEATLFTAYGSVMGTPLYMAPEQATFNAVDVDTRADIYALGVILFELITGNTPLARDSIKTTALDELLKMIREIDAPSPSSRLSSSGKPTHSDGSANIEATKLSRVVKGELDWIVLKALSKDRNQRYESANAFARDIQRYLNNEPVSAGPPSATYRLSKFVRRNRGRVIVGGLLISVLLAGMIGTVVGLLEARKQRDKANLAQQEMAVLADAERAATQLTEKRLEQIELINSALFEIFEDLNINVARESNQPIEQLLANKLIEVGEKLSSISFENPLVIASFNARLAGTLNSLGKYDDAVRFAEASLKVYQETKGDEDPDTLIQMSNLCNAYMFQRNYVAAFEIGEKAYSSLLQQFGTNDSRTNFARSNLAFAYNSQGNAQKALPLLEEVYAFNKLQYGIDSQTTLSSMGVLASALRMVGRNEESLKLFQQVLERQVALIGSDMPQTLLTQAAMAKTLEAMGRTDDAIEMLEKTLAQSKAKLGSDHPTTVSFSNALSNANLTPGGIDRSLKRAQEELAQIKVTNGPDSFAEAQKLAQIGFLYLQLKDHEKAIEQFTSALDIQQPRGGPLVLTTQFNLAHAYSQVGRNLESIRLLEGLLLNPPEQLKEAGFDESLCYDQLARSLNQDKQFDKAVIAQENCVRLNLEKYGPTHESTLSAKGVYGSFLRDAGSVDRSIEVLEEVLALQKQHLEASSSHTAATADALAMSYGLANRSEDLAKVLLESVENQRQTLPNDSLEFAGALATAALTLSEHDQLAVAEPLLRECLPIRQKLSPDDWKTFNTQSMLGGALLAQKKYDEAEPLLIEGYQGMRKQVKSIPKEVVKQRLEAALDRLELLYVETGKLDEAEKWKQERKAVP